MAPTRTAAVKGKSKTHAGKGTSRSLLASKSKVTKRPVKMLPPSQQKTKAVPKPTKRKQRAYTDKELGLPKLNMITPAGVQKSTGKKKGKVFVDDAVSLHNESISHLLETYICLTNLEIPTDWYSMSRRA